MRNALSGRTVGEVRQEPDFRSNQHPNDHFGATKRVISIILSASAENLYNCNLLYMQFYIAKFWLLHHVKVNRW